MSFLLPREEPDAEARLRRESRILTTPPLNNTTTYCHRQQYTSNYSCEDEQPSYSTTRLPTATAGGTPPIAARMSNLAIAQQAKADITQASREASNSRIPTATTTTPRGKQPAAPQYPHLPSELELTENATHDVTGQQERRAR